MKRSNLALTVAVALFGPAAAFYAACETPVPASYLLTTPRVLAIRSTPPDLIPLGEDAGEGQVTLDALLYLPPGSPKPTYSWSWCVTVNSTLQCAEDAGVLESIIDPEGEYGVNIDYALGSDASAVLSYPAPPFLLQSLCIRRPTGGFLLDDAGEDGGLDDGSVEDAAAFEAGVIDGGFLDGLACTGTSWPIAILLTVNVGDTTLQAERALTVYFAPPATKNTNPTITGLATSSAMALSLDGSVFANAAALVDGGFDDAGIGSVTNGTITIAAEVPLVASDLYVGSVPGEAPLDGSTSEDAACIPEDGGEELDGGPICAPQLDQEVYESLSIAWYVGAGEIAETTTTMAGVAYGSPQDWSSLLENHWTAPSGVASVPLTLVVRDNRGGIGWLTQSVTTPLK